MDDITSILNKYADEEGWDTHTKLSVCLSYIKSQQSREDIHQMNIRSGDTFEAHIEEFLN